MRPLNLFALLVAGALLAACSSDATGPDENPTPGTPTQDDSGPVPLTDAVVFAQATADAQWVWYKRSADTLSPASDSPHAARLRTRYNTVAAIGLDSAGLVAAGTIFQDGALIVKEVYQDGALDLLAVMIKATGDPNAGHGAWLWAEYRPNGEVVHSLAVSGESCHSCHIPGVDHTRMNDAHP